MFPPLDCASCITTPKMAAAAHHEKIALFTYSNLNRLERDGDLLKASITQRPRYVDPAKCIGCRPCEYACPVYMADKEQGGFSASKAIAIPFSNALPQIAVLDTQNCMLCGRCAKVCPTGAVDYLQQPQDFTIRSQTVVLATGFELTPLTSKQQYGNGSIPNVITSLQMERLLALVELEVGGRKVRRARVSPARYLGCGACVAVCPENAIDANGWTLKQYEAMVDRIVADKVSA